MVFYKKIFSLIFKAYDNAIFSKSNISLFLLSLIIIFFSFYISDFKLDSSADSLVLENDSDLKYYRAVSAKYGSEDFVVITFSPFDKDLFSKKNLLQIENLIDDLKKINRVESVTSILDVPLLYSPKLSLSELSHKNNTLRKGDVDIELVKKEFLESPLYKNLLTSENNDTTVLLVKFKRDKTYQSLLSKRQSLRDKKYNGVLNNFEKNELKIIEKKFSDYSIERAKNEKVTIKEIRNIMSDYKEDSRMFLGGIPMIASDMTDFIEQDIKKFGIGILLFLIITLSVIFRSIRWVVIPLVGCIASVIFVSGFSGFADWRLTVISSNFPSLLLIITMSMTIHLVVRYREINSNSDETNKIKSIKETIYYMFIPCIYTSLTTIVAFISLFVSGIRPIIDFGHMMTFGIISAFIITFIIFPTIISLIPYKKENDSKDLTKKITLYIAKISNQNYKKIILVSVIVAFTGFYGISNLKVENRFIDYFHNDTEIHKGMLEIDQKLGGTTPFDIIIKAPDSYLNSVIDQEEDDLFGELSEALGDENTNTQSYWLTIPKIKEIKKIHYYLESLDETGKVLSISTLTDLVADLNGGPLSDLQIGAIRSAVSDQVNEVLLKPYLSDDGNEIRISLRVIDSNKQLKRKDFIEQVEGFLLKDMGYQQDQFRTSNMLVLYNNMLQSLFSSQIQTIGFVFISILIMFIFLFKSLSLALISIIPNMIPATIVLGFMGLKEIPLDLMTITIAAISVGIAVDNTIHYIIRFKREFNNYNNYESVIERCHSSIGKAMYYTSLIIVVGFSILSLSNFIPTIYFGLLTGLAMLTALISSLLLLPSMLVFFKPLGKKQ